MERKNKKKLYFLYTLIFIFFSVIIVFYYYSNNKSLIYAGDDYRSSYFENVYLSKYIRKIIKSFFETGKLVIPQWDFCISEGYDILHSFNTGLFGDPFCLFGFLFPEDKMYIFYDLMRLLRVYCAGLAFIYLCLYFKKDNVFAVLTGAISYCFCSTSLSALLINPFMVTPMVFFPLVIVGVNKVINKENPYLLVFSVTLSAISNFYFFYSIVILTVVYSIIKLLFIHKDIKQFFIELFRIAGWSILGTCLGAVIILPVVMSFFNYNRLDASYPFHLFYPSGRYLYLFSFFNILTDASTGLISGYSILCFVSIAYLIKKRNNKMLILFLLIGMIFTMFPFFEQMFNGFSYPSTRWHRFLSLLICYIVVESFDGLKKLGHDFVIYLALILIYNFICLKISPNNIKFDILLTFLLLFVLVVVNKTKINELYKNASLLSVSLLAVMLSLYFSLSPSYWNFVRSGVDIEKANVSNNIENNTVSAINDDTIWRYSGNNLNDNESTIGEHSATNFYWSISNNDVINYRTGLGMSDHNCFHYTDYNNKSSLMNLASIKYFLADHNDQNIPYGYELYKTDDNYNIYVNNNVLPFIYSYSNAISKNDWQQLSIIQKQEALLKSIVLNDTDSNNDNHYQSKQIKYNILSNNDATISNEEIYIKEANTTLNIDFDYQGPGEYYFLIHDLYWYSDANGTWQDHLYSNIKVNTTKSSNTVYYKTPDHTRYSNRHTFSINLGYFEDEVNSIELVFPETGKYAYKSIEVVYLPLMQQDQDIEQLKDVIINELKIETNTVKSTVTIPGERYVVFSIPYSKSWTAYVDGKKADLLNANIQYMGLLLDEGTHNIELKYKTPFLKEGLIISCVSLAVLIFIIKNQTQKEKKDK